MGKNEGILDHPAYMTFIPKLWTDSRKNDFWCVDFNEFLLDQEYVTVHLPGLAWFLFEAFELYKLRNCG